MHPQSKSPRNWQIVWALVVATAGLQACTAWPTPATGGLAERHPTGWVALRHLEERYNWAVKAGGERFAAGRMAELELLITRAQREHDGGLLADSDQTLAKADRVMNAIENDLNSQRTGNRRHPRT